MLRSFPRISVENALAEANQLLVERPAADSMPRREAVRSSDDDVEEKAHMVDQPRHDRVIDWDVLAYTLL